MFGKISRTRTRKVSNGGEKMEKYVCQPCGYVYDPENGDPDGGIAPGTAFEDLPDDWLCPICVWEKKYSQKKNNTDTPCKLVKKTWT